MYGAFCPPYGTVTLAPPSQLGRDEGPMGSIAVAHTT